MGAVLITLVGTLLAKIMSLARIRKLLQTSFAELLPWKNLGGILLSAMAAAIPAVILNGKLDIPVLVLMPLSGIAYMVTYIALVLAFGLLDKDEIAAIKRSLYVWNRGMVHRDQ